MTGMRNLVLPAVAALGILAAPQISFAVAPTSGTNEVLRLTEAQYRQVIRDVFGPTIRISGAFEPDVRTNGLLAVGAARVSVSDAGFEQYDSIARIIAQQVVDEKHRAMFVRCGSASEATIEASCAKAFIANTGRLLWRRPLSAPELKDQMDVVRRFSTHYHDLYAGLAASLTDMLDSPNFLFRSDTTEPDPSHPGNLRLTAYSKASRLSFFLWNSTPDDELMKSAETGAIHAPLEVQRQVARLLRSSKLEQGTRAFFSDMLGFDAFDTLVKNGTVYPSFTLKVKEEAPEQTLRTIVDLLLAHDGDYRDLFTTRETFLTTSLAILYGTPFVDTQSENGVPEKWIAVEYPVGDPHSGILSQASFTALHSHPGRSSPTVRGKALRELLFCQTVPPPPGNVDFTLVTNADARYKTVRERISAHVANPVCAGCHKITDPIGLAFENFDGGGGFRRTENDAPIDASGTFNDKHFSSLSELQVLVHDSPVATSCVAKRAFAFGAGHLPPTSDQWHQIEQGFASSNYRYRELLKLIGTNDLFFQVTPDESVKQTPNVAQSHQ